MRGADVSEGTLFNYRTLEKRIPKEHPLRKLSYFDLHLWPDSTIFHPG